MIVVLIGQGAQNKEIADQLHISVNTVKTHVYSIYRKTSCRNRVELIKWSMPALKAVS
jgi:DNA-binding CsgD family transcriptional regulator